MFDNGGGFLLLRFIKFLIMFIVLLDKLKCIDILIESII